MVGLVRGAQVSVRRRGLVSRRAQRHRARVQDARPNGPQQKLPLVRGPNVPGAGLEPAQTKVRGILSPLRLPIPPSRRALGESMDAIVLR